MAKKKRYSKQQIKKKFYKICFFCHESDYHLLDVHRLVPGCEGGKYHEANTLSVCCKCHRRIHAGEIRIDSRKYLSTSGRKIIHFWINGEEKWEAE